jgi:hypothetical protein
MRVKLAMSFAVPGSVGSGSSGSGRCPGSASIAQRSGGPSVAGDDGDTVDEEESRALHASFDCCMLQRGQHPSGGWSGETMSDAARKERRECPDLRMTVADPAAAATVTAAAAGRGSDEGLRDAFRRMKSLFA